LARIAADVKFQLSADSGPGLVQSLVANPRMLLTPDEMVDLFDKGKQTNLLHSQEWSTEEFFRESETNMRQGQDLVRTEH
jgi:hypothetical protein